MKVRESQIPEESGKPMFVKQENVNNRDSFRLGMDDEESGDEEAKYIKRMISLDSGNTVLSLFGIESIEKDMRFVEKPKARWEYGIIINKGIVPSIRFPKTDIGIWYEKEAFRDKKFDELMEVLRKEGVKVIES